MEHWQQRSFRQDPWPTIPWGDGRRFDPDTLVGLACVVVGIIGIFL